MEEIIFPDGSRVAVDRNISWEGFCVGDLIVYLGAFTSVELYGKKVRIRGISSDGQLYVMNNEEMYLARFQRNHYEDPGMILLERPGYRFKVGDKVKDQDGNNGVVIVLNPDRDYPRPFLVEFVSDIGHNACSRWYEPWYPRSYKTDSKRRSWMVERKLTLISDEEFTLPDNIQKQTTTDEYSGQRKIARKIFAEIEARLAKGEFPVFEPQDLAGIDSGEGVEIKSSKQARNLRECMRMFGAMLFHLVNAESEFDMECYIVDPDLAYRKKMPKGDFGALIEELLFGQECAVERVREMISRDRS